ncbi:MmgE/PrpD family protein [Falsiroseomonas oryzae]|uniref:MmgE/PrpD family protein n=1 Tax=Falsiroseomonas oryzae TaxID=2766473 RepID=UPI0022EB8C2B|nr:MmgE/PrpD family protein [Roseomonas sp. MO-31]
MNDLSTTALQAGTEPAPALARFAARLQDADIPAEVRRRAAHHLLDAIGIAFASSRMDFAHRTLTAVRGLGGSGEVPVIGMPARLSPRDAAMVNGLLVHGLDFDDTHLGGVIHPTASVFPAVFSTAMSTGASGAEMVTAYIAGVEVANRLGAVAKGGFHKVGFHPTGMVGVFGCTLAAGRLMGLTERELTHAQGIALSLASGSLEFLEDGAWNKRLHPGWAAQAGMTAAALARQGFVGATNPLSGRFGLFNSYLGPLSANCDMALATAGLGRVWEIARTSVKPYPACHFTHACVDAALALRAQGVRVEDIAAIEALLPEGVMGVVCEPEANKKRPANGYDAQFSIPFLVAAALVRGRLTLAEVEGEALSDAAILEVANKVTSLPDPDSPFPRAYSGEVVVKLKDGRTLRHREQVNRGAPDRPLADADIVEKFRGNAALALSAANAARVEAAVLGLDAAPDAQALAGALAG